MKKAFSILMVAFAMTAMVACGEKDVVLDDNTLVYDGTTYHMNAFDSFYHSGLTTVDATSQETDADGNPMVAFARLHVRPTMWNKTVDIFTATSDEETWECFFHGALFGEEPVNVYDFSACTIGVSGNNDGTPVTVTLEGTMKNGKKIQMKLVTHSW